MEFGIQLGNMEPARYRANAQAAEALGYDLIVFPDHLVNEGPERQYDLKTLDRLSGGRLIAGLGTGWTETEFKMSGIAFPPITERLRMLDEAMTCILSLWTNERTTFDGEFYKFKDAIQWPKPIQQPHPPIILGGGGKGLLRLAAKYADYINIIPDSGKRGHISMEVLKRMTDDSFREKVRFIRDEAGRLGRKPDAVRISNFIFAAIISDSHEATRKTAEMMAPMFRQTPDALLASPMTLIGTPEECIVELKRRAKDWSMSQIIFTGAVAQDEKLMRRLHEEVLAHV